MSKHTIKIIALVLLVGLLWEIFGFESVVIGLLIAIFLGDTE
jgi:hypothetical protein